MVWSRCVCRTLTGHVRILDLILDLNAPDSTGFQWFPPERKKGPKGPDFNHLQNSVELCSAIFGAGNETRIWRQTH